MDQPQATKVLRLHWRRDWIVWRCDLLDGLHLLPIRLDTIPHPPTQLCDLSRLPVRRAPLHAHLSHHFHCALAAIGIRVAADDHEHPCNASPSTNLLNPARTPRCCLSGLNGFFRALHTLGDQHTSRGPSNAERRRHILLHSSPDPRLLAAHVERSTKHRRRCWNSRCTPQWRQK